MLKLIDISKSFGGLKVLDKISLEVKKERLGIIGPNGAGKTTLFNIISGFVKPDSGDIFFMGKSIVGKKPRDLANLGIVRTFQITKVFENMTVEENLKVITDDLSILKDFDLESRRKELAKNLSQGEMRRLSLALALARNPRLLLLDEPFSGLSKKEVEKILGIIKELGGNGTAVAIVEHRMGDLFNAVERVIVLNEGKLIFDGSPEDVLESRSVMEAYFGKRYVKG
ncbi:MAG: ABC transporter ATP-binding protein [Archaeoglobi archaeon]|jgi:branched-chain amino acid transport system ATP-binding protein|nr:ABC transporter ATP-binding protein [Archaeoglobus sp.]NHW88662.1 ABC transporter ATP-binding protein [Archaeoglobales archaeon]TDA26768.1 MAG: ABC transporter ATP-binding protein [Archaeoglobi archaeon]